MLYLSYTFTIVDIELERDPAIESTDLDPENIYFKQHSRIRFILFGRRVIKSCVPGRAAQGGILATRCPMPPWVIVAGARTVYPEVGHKFLTMLQRV